MNKNSSVHSSSIISINKIPQIDLNCKNITYIESMK